MVQAPQSHLLDVVRALQPPCRLPSRLHGRHQQADQNPDDRDHHQEFHERERGARLQHSLNRAIVPHEREPSENLPYKDELLSDRLAAVGRIARFPQVIDDSPGNRLIGFHARIQPQI